MNTQMKNGTEKKLEKDFPIFIVRHGMAGSDNRLSETGKEQIKRLAESMRQAGNWTKHTLIMRALNDPEKITLLCSTAPRAVDSANQLCEELGITHNPILMEELWSDAEHPYGPEKISFLKEEIRRTVADLVGRQTSNERWRLVPPGAVIVVTHEEFVNEFPGDAYNTGCSSGLGYAEGIMLWNSNHGMRYLKVSGSSDYL